MKNLLSISFLLVLLLLNGCGSSTNVSSENNVNNVSNANTAPSPPPINPSAKIENGQKLTFNQFSFVLPADWEKIAVGKETLLYKSPTVDSIFSNFMIVMDSAKTEFTELEPQPALIKYKEKKETNGQGLKQQPLKIDNISGILSEGEPSSTQSKKEYLWLWTTFIKTKEKKFEVRIVFACPLEAKDKFKPIIDGVFNSLKIQRSPDVQMIDSVSE